MLTRRGCRVALGVVVLLSVLTLTFGLVTADRTSDFADTGSHTQAAPPRDGITVIATDSNTFLGSAQEGPRSNAELVAFAEDGSTLYYNDSHTRYWDVDPVEGTNATVEYLYADHLPAEECNSDSVCTRNGIERVNLTTGNVTDVYSRVTPGKHSTRWHDGDRLNDTRYVVADIAQDRVFVVNTSTELVEWSWDAQAAYPRTSGGPYPEDWTHVNDVEVVQDGRIMASLRNQDQVVFLDRETGLVENWTLGEDGDHDTIYEQHNPDYIPAENGGPAVLVADSENNRIVEYQRTDGNWTRSWTWSDARAQWPRDADRLPNGNTLITDSNGNRVFEVNPQGEVVWSVDVAFPYEAERLGTGDESTGGQSMQAIGGESSTGDDDSATNGSAGDGGAGPGAGDDDGAGSTGNTDSAGLLGSLWLAFKGLLPGKVFNALMYVKPIWMGALEVAALVVGTVSLLVWAVLELRWTPYSVSVQQPLELHRD
ncbi:aryl-sulfate sulfotransferase [Haloarchaeobius amylolyticus]|uniref:aryl-sulfate sulfotransferase n=1 Tax=Haloarchaeobius amylolyticus TaxID=1198296 RepID=UPI00226F7DD5|nr:aryl-sulfate sulfotransferase [Haloarchaeobius amylolyticus]